MDLYRFSASGSVEATWPVRALRLAGLAMIVYGDAVVFAYGHAGWHAIPRAAAVVLLVVTAAAWLVWTFSFPSRTSRLSVVSYGVWALTGGFLAATVLPGPSLAFSAVACLVAGVSFEIRHAVGVCGAMIVLLGVGQALGSGLSFLGLLSVALLFVVCLYSGVGRSQRIARHEQTELLLAETQLAQEEQARAAALAERARIAREIHDVLAHSLSALAVQLDLVDALLDDGRVDEARTHVRRSRGLTAEGLTETRRAIAALRDDSVPLPELLDRLAEAHRTDVGTPTSVEIVGTPRPLPAPAALALYRTAQESFTNARRHAPGAEVAARLVYESDQVTLTVADTGSPSPPCAPGPENAGAGGALGSGKETALVRSDTSRGGAGPGGGYGLVGMRERAELAGGELRAGPAGAGWSVDVTIPV